VPWYCVLAGNPAGTGTSFTTILVPRSSQLEAKPDTKNGKGRCDQSTVDFDPGCEVSAMPLRSIVGPDKMFPPWNEIKNMYPDALDSFSSPGHDLVIVVVQGKLIVAPVLNGKVARSLARIQINGRPVMVQWSLGAYVDRWTAQLKPFLSTYEYKPNRLRSDDRRRRADDCLTVQPE
jgi:hypothetical protein